MPETAKTANHKAKQRSLDAMRQKQQTGIISKRWQHSVLHGHHHGKCGGKSQNLGTRNHKDGQNPLAKNIPSHLRLSWISPCDLGASILALGRSHQIPLLNEVFEGTIEGWPGQCCHHGAMPDLFAVQHPLRISHQASSIIVSACASSWLSPKLPTEAARPPLPVFRGISGTGFGRCVRCHHQRLRSLDHTGRCNNQFCALVQRCNNPFCALVQPCDVSQVDLGHDVNLLSKRV